MMIATKQGRPSVLLFDVNETLLDLAPVKENVDAVLIENGAWRLWFTTMLHYSLVTTVANRHAPLLDIGVATLQMLARNRDVVLPEAEAREALEPMLTLAPHRDVIDGLTRLKSAGFRLATLTNSPEKTLHSQLQHAGLANLFERHLSVESVGKYKPHADVYRWASEQMAVDPGQCMLVAAHAWDIAGAAWAGLQTAFIERSGNQIYPLGPPPSLSASDLDGLAAQLGAASG